MDDCFVMLEGLLCVTYEAWSYFEQFVGDTPVDLMDLEDVFEDNFLDDPEEFYGWDEREHAWVDFDEEF